MLRVLITGGAGQDGYYLQRLCADLRASVLSVGRSGPDRKLDVSRVDEVMELVAEFRPTHVFHFSAESRLGHDALLPNHNAIVSGATNVLEACWRHCREARVFLPGSAVQFRNVGEPIDENTPFAADSAYAVGRIHSTYLARYFRTLGLRCYVGYLFHHDSPLRASHHLSQRIARGVAAIAAGQTQVLEIGGLAMQKEWTFAGDTVRAMWTLVNQDEHLEAVIGSGQCRSVQDWVEACCRAAGLDMCDRVREDPEFRLPFTRSVSNPARLLDLGWRPTVDLSELASMMVTAAKFKL